MSIPPSRGPAKALARQALSAVAAIAVSCVATANAFAVDFLRGDANSDGAVSLADSHFIDNFLFRGGTRPECLASVDVNRDGRANITDSIFIINALFRGGPLPAAPFPDAGPAPEDEALECESYGGGTPLDDPAAVLTLVAEPTGGDGTLATLRFLASSSTSLGGLSATVRLPPALAGSRPLEKSEFVVGETEFPGLLEATSDGGVLRVGYLASLTAAALVPPGVDVPVLEVTFCLPSGMAAGPHAFVIEEAELIDSASGRAIAPRTQGDSLDLPAAVADSDCSLPGGGGGLPDGVVLDPPVPENPEVTFRLGDVTVEPGTEGSVPFTIFSNGGVQAFSFSIDFDESVLDVTSIDELIVPTGDTGFRRVHIDDTDSIPGDSGIEEGFIVGAIVYSFLLPAALAPDTEHTVFRFRFRGPDVEEAVETSMAFVPGAAIPGGSGVMNATTIGGEAYDPAELDSFVLIDCAIQVLPVLPDVSIFIRADANGDLTLDLSDPVATLGALFLGQDRPQCWDAADANDDGRLNVADPVFTLQYLFLGGDAPPAPFPMPGEDPTPDAITCRFAPF